MAQIQTYPRKTTYDANDLILICDKTPDANGVVTNDTKTTTLSTIADNLNVVETLNGLKGDINITGGSNITVTPSGQNIQISTSSSNVDGSGTAGTIPKWSDSNTLTDSIIKDQGGLDILIPRYIKHDGDTSNLFGFKDTGEFLVSVDSTAEDQFSVAADAIIMKTDSGTKVAAGPTSVTLYNDENGSTTTSKISLTTYDSGIIVKGGTENSFARGGAVRFYTSTNNGYVGISGPTTTGTNYEIVLPNAVGTANQVLKLPSTIGTSPYQLAWGDAGSDAQGSTGSVQFKASTGVFQGSTSFIFESSNDKLTVGDTANDRAGIIEIQSDENGGTLKIGGGSQQYYTSIKGSDSDTANYEIILPPAGPGSNNKILESNSTGQLSWITTPTVPAATNTTLGGIKVPSDQSTQVTQPITTTAGRTYNIQLNAGNFPVVNVPWTGTSSTASASSIGGIKLFSDITLPAVSATVNPAPASKNYGVQITSLDQAAVHVPWENTTDITLTTNGGSGAATWNGTTLNIPNYTPTSGAVQSITSSSKFSPTDTAYLSALDLTNAFGNVNLGVLNLNATNFPGGIPTPGVDDTRFLIKDNHWASLWPAQVNFLGGIQLSSATVQTVAPNTVSSTASKTYSVQLDSNNKAVVNVPWSTDITLTTTGTSGAASWNGTTLNIPQYSGSGNVGFSPMSIYEGEVEVGTAITGNDVSFARQTIVESDCTINRVQFFRLTGTNEISIYVYEGTISDPANATLVLAGTMQQGGPSIVNSINEIAFSKSGYTSHTFSAGTAIIIVACFRSGDGGANALGNDTLKRVTNLSASGNFYVDEVSAPVTYEGFDSELQEANDKGVSMHFSYKPS